VSGISREMSPFFRMTAPPDFQSLADVRVEPGKRLFRSRVFLFVVLPIDYSDITLLELTPQQGFVEQSPMRSMRLWRHERRIESADSDDAVILIDRLTFEPRHARAFVGWFMNKVFRHRHAVLRKAFDGVEA
jgi:hypothetical protein